MPCHVDEIPPQAGEIETVVEVVNRKITIKNVGDGFHGKYPTLKAIVEKCRKRFKTFHYKASGCLVVIVSPCPKGC